MEEARKKFNLFEEICKEHGSRSAFEIPMEYFAFTVENALTKNGSHGDEKYWITVTHWKEAIESSGYNFQFHFRSMSSTTLWLKFNESWIKRVGLVEDQLFCLS